MFSIQYAGVASQLIYPSPTAGLAPPNPPPDGPIGTPPTSSTGLLRVYRCLVILSRLRL